jgi:LuxR family transcriptional regulator, maltose regulon positive regulatory protein
MENTILNTKFFIPEARPKLVHRDRLIERLDAGVHRKLSLISAPAGFGKTTLVTEWLDSLGIDANNETQAEYKIAWLSLDEGDNDLVRFLTYLIAALRRIEGIDENFGKGAMSMLQSTQMPPTEVILAPLINDIAAISGKIIFVLDDYHLIEAQPIHDAFGFLLENIPPQMHLVIATREDPHLPLARLRAKDQLTELRAADLRFTSSEAAKFLNQVMDLDLSSEDIFALEKRTEGWIAGLQLAAISLKGQTDTSRHIQLFTGNNRLVIDYLIEDVFNQQPQQIQTFLLQTSILDSFNSSLCDALTGQENGQATLEQLEHSNLFIVSLDNERRWHRYHHLFADLLRQRLRYTQLESLPDLHIRASEWYAQNGFPDQAIEHALQAKDFDRAVNLIEEQADACWKRAEHAKLQNWLDMLPVEFLLSNPNLCVFQAWEQFNSKQQDAAETTLQRVEGLDSIQDLLSESDRMRIQGRVAAIRAFLAFHKGAVDAIFRNAQLALDYLPEDDIIWRNTVNVALGDAFSMAGHVEDAARIRLETWETSKAIGNIYMNLIASMKYCVTLRQQGKLEMIKKICRQQMTLAKESGLALSPEAGWILAVWGEVLAEQGDLDQAVKKTREGKELAQGGYIGILYVCIRHLIVALFSSEDFAGLEAIIQEVEEYGWDRLPSWIVVEIEAWQLRLWLAQGKIEETSQWFAEQDLEVTGNPDRSNERKYLALVRLLIATRHPSDTLDLLERVYTNAYDRGDISKTIEILNLQALAMQAADDTQQAMNVLEKSLALAEPLGFLFAFVNEGPPMAKLLYEALSRGNSPDYVQKLLAAFPIEKPKQLNHSLIHTQDDEWIEPLTDREVEVLQLIAEGLSRKEISTHLFISLNTVKAHTRNIFQKLGVRSQLQAVTKAQVLGLLEKD